MESQSIVVHAALFDMDGVLDSSIEADTVEDAPSGIRAGKSAGCPVLAVASSHRTHEPLEAGWGHRVTKRPGAASR
jgi:beta-phosphoglucomutase-like phosphatase (HAD superfamily)